MKYMDSLAGGSYPTLKALVDEELMVADSNPLGHSPATCSRLGSAGTEPNKQDNHQDHEKVHESNNTHDSGTHSHRRPLSLPLFGKTADHAKAALKRRSVGLFARQANKEILEVIKRDLAENQVKSESAHDDLETMDRRGGAMGPRAPVLSNVNPAHGEEQRTQAFESIFGRPSAAHRDVQAFPQVRPQQTNTPSYYPQQYQQQAAQSRHYQPQSLPQHQYARPQRTPEPPYGYPYEYSRSNYQHSFVSASNGIVTSPPAPPVDPSLESLTNKGLTPAQAYQAQVFANNHQRMGLPPGAHPPHTQNGSPLGRASSMTTSPPPRLDSLNIQENGGRLSLDFVERDNQPVVAVEVLGNSREKLESEEDGDSELPWINAGQRTPTGSQKATGSSQPTSKPYSNSSSTPPSSVDIHEFRSTGPPKLNIDFGTSPPFSSQTFGDSGPNRRLSIETSKALPPINLSQANTGSTTPSSQVGTPSSSASSSYARRSLPSETPRTRTPLSQLSFAASNATSTALPSPAQNGPGTPVSQLSAQPTRRGPKRAPLVYPALLSRVAEALLQRLPLSVRTKHGLSYPDAFDGREAVDKICYIIKTTDRSLALLLGRALDAQKFFHDVTYDHRLRDNSNEIYQFKSSVRGLKLTDSSTSGTILGHVRGDSKSVSPNTSISGSSHRPSTSKASTQDSSASSNDHGAPHHYQSATEATVIPISNQSFISQSYTSQQVDDHAVILMEEPIDEMELPTGVFTMLTECYSATCTRDHLCYSITCPRRMEQQARLNNRPGSAGGHRSTSGASSSRVGRRATIGGANGIPGSDSLPTSPVTSTSAHGHPQGGIARLEKRPEGDAIGMGDDDEDGTAETGQLWIHSVAKEIADTLSDTEKKRQEAINEVIYTERDFVRDMEYLRDVWVAGIRNSDIIPIERREAFISQVFWNLLAIIDVNTRLRDALTKRQKQYTIVGEIGDIFLEIVPLFSPFVDYGAHQMYGKYEFEKEKANNPAFAAFVEDIERLPESRKLELNGYLTKPTTRLARYPLLLEAVLKHTPESSPDKLTLQEVIKTVRGFLTRVNQKTGEAENRFHLHQLERQLVFRPGEYVDLQLSAEHRKLVYKGALNRRGGSGDKEDLQVFFFDHALLMVKPKTKGDQYKVFRRPIPLELLHVSAADESLAVQTIRPSTTGRAGGKAALVKPGPHEHHSVGSISSTGHNSPLSLGTANNSLIASNKNGFPITFTHLGWRGYSITLWASTFISKKKWMETIQQQQDLMRERSRFFETAPFAEGFFTGSNRVNCAVPFNGGRRIAYGTDDGVYFSDFQESNRGPVKVLALLDVTQLDILEETQLLIVLSERSVITFPLSELNPMDPQAGLRRGERIAAHTSFFKTGVCINKTIVCVVKTSALSTTVKTFEPVDQNIRNKSKPTFRKLLQGGNDTLKLFKEFYIPVETFSLTVLKSHLCIGCARGFQIVNLETLDTQPLVDPDDVKLEFIDKKDNLRPLAIFRVDTEFLLCYDEWAVFVDRRGHRARGDWQIEWEGRPTAFAFHYPYVIAIEPTFIEIWDIVACMMKQVIPGSNLRCLFAEPPPSGTMYSANVSHGYPGWPHNGMGQQQYMGGPPPPHLTGPYPPRGSSAAPPGQYGGRSNIQGQGYPAHGPPGSVPPYPAPIVGGYNFGRREILLSSEDNVMFLKPSIPNIGPLPGTIAPSSEA